jgi:fatty-acyl-CoA synthase
MEVLQDLLSDENNNLPHLKHIVSNQKVEKKTSFTSFCLTELYKEWQGDLREFKATSTNPKQIYNMLYTSGTTSKPKGVMLSQKTVIYHSYNAGTYLGINSGDIVLGALPFCGIFGFNTLFMALSHGVPIVPVDRYQSEQILTLIENHKCTIFNGVDGMFTPLKNSNNYDVSSIRIGAVAIFTSSNKEFIQNVALTFENMVVVQPYGMTEVGSLVFVGEPSNSLEKRSLAGGFLVSPEIQVDIINSETEDVLPFGAEGEITIKGYNVMQGYYDNAEKTNEVFTRDGKFKTGDLGIKYEDGSIIYKGRIAEAFRLKGFLVSPKEIEDYLCQLEEVHIAQVVHVEHKGKASLVAFLKLHDGLEISEERVNNFCNKGLADFKRPRTIYQVTEFPRTAGSNGEKIQKNKLKELALDILANEKVSGNI